MFKIFNYIFVKVPEGSSKYDLGIPYTNLLWYETGKVLKRDFSQYGKKITKYMMNKISDTYFERCAIIVPHIKPDSGIKYHIIGKVFNYVIIKIN